VDGTGSADEADAVQDAFFTNGGRLSNLDAVLSLHPRCLKRFTATHAALFDAAGPLTKPDRYYIAIMAASRLRCNVLVDHYKALFASAGGDRRWLRKPSFGSHGNPALPRKLQSLGLVNALLAH